MNVALDVHVLEMPGFDPKQARHVYDMATLYESEDDAEGNLVLLVSTDTGKLVEVPAAECVVHHPFHACVFRECATLAHAVPYAGRSREATA